MSIDTAKEYEAIFRTADGDIRVLLNDDLAPVTVNNFVNLAQDGFYDGVTFHRVISLGTGFIAQGGDPTGSGSGGPGYRFDDEAAAMTDFNTRDLLAMANAGTDTNGSQFFFTLAPQTHLNGRHAIFGQVIEGSDVVDAINKRDVSSSTPAEVIYAVDIVTR
ncbi:MAG: peptidylprolyl isomerase [Mariniblastus sp.]|nr:peptidylprolyl isomerase [Mariniblastus sp.]